jgi:hypothetical protein
MKASRVDQALVLLLDLMNEPDAEYPDVHARVCIAFDLNDEEAQELTEEYDTI